jgi:hypothetical protein
MNRYAAEQTTQTSTRPGALARAGTPAARILDELDVVVRNSHRRTVLGRILHGVGRAFATLLFRTVSEQPPLQSDPAPGNLASLVFPIGRLAEDTDCRRLCGRQH